MSDPRIDARYERYAAYCRALHRLFLDGRSESDEADELRDQMDGPWEALTEEQQALVSGLIADLNWIRRDPVRSDADREAAIALPRLAPAVRRSDWSSVVEILRRAAPSMPRPQVAYLRARAWEELGDSASAELFDAHAIEQGFDAFAAVAAAPVVMERPIPAWAQSDRVGLRRVPRAAEARG